MRRRGQTWQRRLGQRAALAGSLSLLVLLGCDRARRPSGEAPPASALASSSTDSAAADAEPCAPAHPRACFGKLTTIAGTGTIRRKGKNGWRPAFEGGPALQAELSRPHFAMADASGNVYIADKDAHAVRKVAADGSITTVAGMNAPGDDGDQPGPGAQRHLSAPNGLWVQPDGTLFILDLGNERVRRLSTTGELTTVLKVPRLTFGRGLWVSADEQTAFVASGSRVLRWTARDGLAEFATGFDQLANLFFVQDGTLLVTDRGAGRLYALRDGGQREVLAGGGSTAASNGVAGAKASLPGLRAVWPDGQGGLLLGLHQGSAVWYLDSSRILRPVLDDTEVSEVRGLSLDTAGNLLITDHDAGYIKRLPRR